MRHFLGCLIFIALSLSIGFSQNTKKPAGDNSSTKIVNQTAKLPVAAPILSTSLCGTGTYLIQLGTQPLGRETFEIKCSADGGFQASGKTKMEIPGAPLEVDTTLELDKTGALQRFTAKGTAAGKPVDQTITINKEVATVVNAGESKDVPYHGAPMFAPQSTYTFQFLLARYDAEKGGQQKVPIFPSGDVTIERTARDNPQLSGIATPAGGFDRYALQLGPATIVLWVDGQGRLALLSVPAQNVTAVREEYQAYSAPLTRELARSVKGMIPDYSVSPDAPFIAKEITIPVKNYTLAGTLLVPKGATRRTPAVVMSTGSGQQKRNEQLGLAGLEQYQPFRQIAETLASRGIAVLRCDDRGVGDSTGIDTLATATTFDFADDVRAQIEYLRSRADIDPDRIAIVGHSEGGMIAPLIAASDSRLAAIVLLAGPAKRGDAVLRYQLTYASDNDPKLSPAEKEKKHQETEEFLRAVASGGDVSKYPTALRMLGSPWGKAFVEYDPLVTIRKVKQPILILQGGLDRQVTPDQANMLAQAAKESGNKHVTVRVFPNLNHLFLPARTGGEDEYTSLTTTKIGDNVLLVIGKWLKTTLKAETIKLDDKEKEEKEEKEREKAIEREKEKERKHP